MFPRWHIILGAVFALVLWAFFPAIAWYYVAIIFLSSFLIDFDHYMTAVWRTGSWSLSDALSFYDKLDKQQKEERRRGIFRKGEFHMFHTVEFHALVFALGFFNPVFFYVLAGMVFHSLCDLVYLMHEQELYRREFFLAHWIRTHLHRERKKRLERIKVTLR